MLQFIIRYILVFFSNLPDVYFKIRIISELYNPIIRLAISYSYLYILHKFLFKLNSTTYILGISLGVVLY